MTSTPFLADWTVTNDRGETVAVTLPHDAMIGERRDAAAPSWAHGGYFPGGRYRYTTTWAPGPAIAGKEVSLRFEGVYRHSSVTLDGRHVGGAVNGYTEFEARLDPYVVPGRTHTIEVDVDNSATPSARWYTGSGISRPVWLEVRDRVHVVTGGVELVTVVEGDTTRVRVDVSLTNPDREPVEVTVVLSRGGQRSARSSVTDGPFVDVDFELEDAARWSADDPALHDLEVVLRADGFERDRFASKVGLRAIALDPARGFLVNGEPALLRGANVHHDNGVLGAATFPGAERRRVRILKEIGFNAIRSAHNPASRALVEACDELGMYLIDEAYDGWYDHKNTHDDADAFDDTWRDQLSSMVRKDALSPSVVMYSIGNENGEALEPRGRRTAATMAAHLRALDPTRFVTIGVNLLGATFAGLGGGFAKEPSSAAAKAAPDMTSTALNALSNRFGMLAAWIPRLSGADRATRDLWTSFDVAGYNYGTARYEKDAALHPDRLVVGTETMPGDLARNWALVERLPTLIGDFMWAGWDYIGESGAGSWAYGTRRAPFMKPYPHLTSGMGIVDITGDTTGAPVQLARAVWGSLDGPAITVRPLDVAPGPHAATSWRATDAVASWSWAGSEGRTAEFEVYAVEDEVELIVNGRSIGRRAAGRLRGFVARFRAPYAPGRVVAIGYRNGVAVSRSELRTAGPARVRVIAEDPLGTAPTDVCHVRVELVDEHGVVDTAARDVVTVSLRGPAVLAGFGNGATATEESFTDAEHSTHRGRALAVIRSTGESGTIAVTVTSRHHGSDALVVRTSTEEGALAR
ncbi:glycoside hydrolase family 2 TIM barrel-domain containing protein [Curtobacterium pusillum]|uniref:glycoside hydrolase family 2 TIM barrel-domain containing protein n=1 Tax=Curtobacterium pusillum TaxID=69373 RepID=UPI00380DAB25